MLKADDRSQPSHCDVYSDMYVLLSGHAASIAEREVALIRFFMEAKQGSKCVNKKAHAGEYSRDHNKAFLYLCKSTGKTGYSCWIPAFEANAAGYGEILYKNVQKYLHAS